MPHTQDRDSEISTKILEILLHKIQLFFSTLQLLSSLAQAEHLCMEMKKFIPLGMPQEYSPTLLFNYTLRKFQVL